MKPNYKFITSLLTPFFILVLCFILKIKLAELSPSALMLIKLYPFIIFSIGIFLSIWFNRSKAFFIILYLFICQLILSNNNIFFKNTTDFFRILYPLICALIPINIFIFSQLRESGIFSYWGKIKFIYIALQFYCVFMFIVSENQQIINFFNYETPLLSNIGFPIPAIPLIIYTSAIVFFIIKILLHKNLNDSKLLILLITSLISLVYVKDNASSSIFLGTSGLFLIFSILGASYSMAYLDELTGIHSRRTLKEDLMKLSNKYVIAMIDVDLFKNFNDTYGHEIGDDVLRLVAENIERVTGGGKAYRYGGEEFTIVFPNKTLAEAVPHLERIREVVSKSGYTRKDTKHSSTQGPRKRQPKQLFVTISIGVAEKNQTHKTATEVLAAADKALYRAKKKGRNCLSK